MSRKVDFYREDMGNASRTCLRWNRYCQGSRREESMTGREDNPRHYDAEDPPRFGEWVRLRELGAAAMDEVTVESARTRRSSLPSLSAAAPYSPANPAPSPRVYPHRFSPGCVAPVLLGLTVMIGAAVFVVFQQHAPSS